MSNSRHADLRERGELLREHDRAELARCISRKMSWWVLFLFLLAIVVIVLPTLFDFSEKNRLMGAFACHGLLGASVGIYLTTHRFRDALQDADRETLDR